MMNRKILSTATAAVTAAAISLASAAPAQAWGKNEQNFLKGVLATVAVGALINQAQKNKREATVARQSPSYAPTTYPRTYTPSYAPSYAPSYTPSYAPSAQPGVRDYSRIPSYTPGYVAPDPARQAFLNASPATRRAVQYQLQRYGFYTGAIDGVWGPRTEQALEDYAAATGNTSRLDSYSGASAVIDTLAG